MCKKVNRTLVNLLIFHLLAGITLHVQAALLSTTATGNSRIAIAQPLVPNNLPVANSFCNTNSCLFYGGDFDSTAPNPDGVLDVTSGGIDGTVYVPFIVPNNTKWRIFGLFGNYFMSPNPPVLNNGPNVYWTINTGMTDGNGGTQIASGFSTAALLDTSKNWIGYELYTINSPVSVVLGPGKYWMAVVPQDSTGTQIGFLANTLGAGSIGRSAVQDASFFNSIHFNINFVNANTQIINADFSAGVTGIKLKNSGDCEHLGWQIWEFQNESSCKKFMSNRH